jgi:hypothetical protein
MYFVASMEIMLKFVCVCEPECVRVCFNVVSIVPCLPCKIDSLAAQKPVTHKSAE